MAAVADRYRRLSDAFAAKVRAVREDGWDARTPCEDWTARDLVGHVVQTQGMFLGFVGEEVGDAPSVDDDPAGAWDAARAAMQARLDDPATATREFDGFAGRSTLEAAVDRFLCTDLVVHGWDLARATGQDERIDPAEIDRVREAMAPLADKMRGPQAFGEEVGVAADADEQTRLLAWLGRHV